MGAARPVNATNLLSNSSFEDYSCNVFGCSFDDWSFPLGIGKVEQTDKLDGEVSLRMTTGSMTATLDNAVTLHDDYYTPGTEFVITIHYKVLALPDYGSMKLDCYWEPEAGGDAEAMSQHDADSLRSVVTDTITGEWETFEVRTSKPAGSARLRVRVDLMKKTDVLFDAFSVEKVNENPDEPFISVTPNKLQPVTATLGETVNFTTLHIEQGNITGTTTFELSGYNPDQFRISATTFPSDQSEIDLIITYAPTEAGTHTAILNIDNLEHTVLFQSVVLQGQCIDPTKQASISVVPDVLPEFSAVVGWDQRDTFTVVSANCPDYVYLRVNHIKGAAFTIDGSMVGKNATSDIVVRFAPTEAGEYQSTVTVYSVGVDTIVIPLNGIGVARSDSNIDWLTHFQWDESHPLTLLNETFDSISHNKTLVLDGWQNVAAVDQRPWWGFDEDRTSPKRGTERYAKATAYQYAKDSTGTWEMFLVTPALDYKNAEGKIFAFSVMGEYLPEDDIATQLQIFYVDASGEKARFQDLTESFAIPSVSEENYLWRTYFLNLEPYAETMADVFHIAFRYVGPNGGAGAVTYYIDNVSWGRTDLPIITVEPTSIIDGEAIVGQERILAEVEVVGHNLDNEISLGLTGTNYNCFNLSESTLPKEGGKFIVSFLAQEEGAYEAYVFLTSKGAMDAFIPVAVRCQLPMGGQEVRNEDNRIRKMVRDGQVLIIRDNKIYNILGISVQ